jgi:protein SCO1/2
MKLRSVWKLLGSSLVLLACNGDTPSTIEQPIANNPLPYFGNHDIELERQDDGSMIADTAYFTVPPFAFTNQSGREISHRDYEGHIYVTDYFFSTCPTICPVMSSQMSRLQDMLKQKGLFGDVKLLSHTVDPEHDTPEVLLAYADRMGADTSHWHFVTGDKDMLYDQARFGYFMTALESDTAAGGFFHSDNFVLVDRRGHLRGFYDGTSTSEVDQLFNDIQRLVQEK